MAGTTTDRHWERDRGSWEVSHRSLLQETVIEVKEGLLGFFGAQRAQHVCMQAAEQWSWLELQGHMLQEGHEVGRAALHLL